MKYIRVITFLVALTSLFSCSHKSASRKGPHGNISVTFGSFQEMDQEWDYLNNYNYEEKPIMCDFTIPQISDSDVVYTIGGVDFSKHSNAKRKIIFYRACSIEYTPSFLVGFGCKKKININNELEWKLVGYKDNGKWKGTYLIPDYNDPIVYRYNAIDYLSIDYRYRYCLVNKDLDQLVSVLITNDMKDIFDSNMESIKNSIAEVINS